MTVDEQRFGGIARLYGRDGLERLAAGLAPGPVAARPRWPLDAEAAPMLGAGKRGAKA